MTDFFHPPVRADVPPSIHPDMVTTQVPVLEVQGTIGQGATVVARNAFAAMYKFYSDVQDADAALQKAARAAGVGTDVFTDAREGGGGLRRLHGREEEFATATERAFASAAAVVDREMAHLRRLRDELDSKVAAAVDFSQGHSGEGLAVSQEVRRHLKAMKPSDRFQFLAKAVADGDRQTVSAALSAPAYLSGLDAQAAGTVRQLAAERWAKVEIDQLTAMDRLVDHLMKGGAACLERNRKVQRYRATPAGQANAQLSKLATA